MIAITCDFCEALIDSKKLGWGEGSSGMLLFGETHACRGCIPTIRQAVCNQCYGKGTISEVDREATSAQATCGESRTQYRKVTCAVCSS